ncbi:hypothetical protein LguiA_007191 [Lonicera macranthoides]
MRSFVFPPIWGLTSLTRLDLTDCNLLACPDGLRSLFSLKELHLGGNKFENLPSLNQLSQLAHLELNRCEMLQELPELPSGIRRLFANDCVSLCLSADRFAMCRLGYFWFQNCRKLLDCGGNEIVASMLLQRKLERTVYQRFNILENIILPGRAIPKWFRNHTFKGHSGLLEFPQNSKIKGYSFFVILEVVNKVKLCKLAEFDKEDNHREYLRWSGLRHDGPITVVGVNLWFKEPDHDHSIHEKAIYLRDTDNIIGQEHMIMGCQNLQRQHSCIYCRWKERGRIGVGIKSFGPDILVVKKWGVRLVFKDDDDNDDDDDYDYDSDDVDVDDDDYHSPMSDEMIQISKQDRELRKSFRRRLKYGKERLL